MGSFKYLLYLHSRKKVQTPSAHEWLLCQSLGTFVEYEIGCGIISFMFLKHALRCVNREADFRSVWRLAATDVKMDIFLLYHCYMSQCYILCSCVAFHNTVQ